MPDESQVCGEITELLVEVAAGNEQAKNDLIERVYQELHQVADALMRKERQAHSWSRTDLLHEAFVRVCSGQFPAKNRAYFFGAARLAMYRLLAEHGGNRPPGQRVPLQDVLDYLVPGQNVDTSDLEEALRILEGFAPREYQVVHLRVFGGMTVKAVAARLQVAVSTVEHDWTWSKTWLRRQLQGEEHDARAVSGGKKHIRGHRPPGAGGTAEAT